MSFQFMRALQCPNRFLTQICALCLSFVYMQTLKKGEEPLLCIMTTVGSASLTIHDIYVWFINTYSPTNARNDSKVPRQDQSVSRTYHQSLHTVAVPYLHSTTSSSLPMYRRDQSAMLKPSNSDTVQGQEGTGYFHKEAQRLG